MKKPLLIALCAIIFWLSGQAQSCLPNGIDFLTQVAIDSFKINYPDCTVIDGDVFISGPGITNMDGLNQLSAIGGGLLIQGNDTLADLNGLSNLSSVAGNLTISDNGLLSDLTGLNNLLAVGGGTIEIKNNPVLAECDIFPVCNWLHNYPDSIIVANNATGCQTPQAIRNQCSSTPVIVSVLIDSDGDCQPDPSPLPAAGIQGKCSGAHPSAPLAQGCQKRKPTRKPIKIAIAGAMF